jgi:DNA polymerase III subunit alpha
VFESLTKAGAFDSLARGQAAGESLPTLALRPRLMAAIDAACEHGVRVQRDKNEGQAQLFGALDGGGEPLAGDYAGDALKGVPLPKFPLPEAKPWSETEQLTFEKETLGLYWSGHPVDRYAADLKEFGARATGELADAPVNPARGDAWGPGGPKPIEPDTSVGGIIAACRQLKTRKGDRMAVFTIEDAQGGVEVIAFPETYQRSAALIESGTLVLVRGKLERDDESVRLLASEIAPLDSLRERVTREVKIRLKAPANGVLQALLDIVSRHRGDRKVSFEVETAGHLRVRMDVSSQIRVRPSPALIAEVEQVTGAGSVELR